MFSPQEMVQIALDSINQGHSNKHASVILFKANNIHLLTHVEFDSDEDKQAAYDVIRHLYQENDCYGYTFLFEAWVSMPEDGKMPLTRPSEDPEKQDGYCVIAKNGQSEEFKMVTFIEGADEPIEMSDQHAAQDNVQFDNPYLIETPKNKLKKMAAKQKKTWLGVKQTKKPSQPGV